MADARYARARVCVWCLSARGFGLVRGVRKEPMWCGDRLTDRPPSLAPSFQQQRQDRRRGARGGRRQRRRGGARARARG